MEENIHSATSPQKCRDMERRYGWQLKTIRKTPNSILKVDCVFYGQQSSFAPPENSQGETDNDK